MHTLFDASGTLEGFSRLVDEALALEAQALLIFCCDANGFEPAQLDPLLHTVSVPLIGALFPQILFGTQKYERGTAMLALDRPFEVFMLEHLSDEPERISTQIANITAEHFETMVVFVDAFSTSIQTLIDGLYREFGLDYAFIGGGAGSLSFIQKPVVFTNQGLRRDAAVLACLSEPCSIGVKHGWESIAGPFMVTKAHGTVIEELDHQSAFERYRRVVEAHSGQPFDEKNFFDIAKAYPFGISKIGAEKVVRDPIARQQEALVCVGNVTNGDYVDILTSTTEKLVHAASSAMHDAYDKRTQNQGVTLFIDCISRVLFMQERFEEELHSVASVQAQLIGAMTLGEIANSGKDYLEFYNKTAVVGVF